MVSGACLHCAAGVQEMDDNNAEEVLASHGQELTNGLVLRIQANLKGEGGDVVKIKLFHA